MPQCRLCHSEGKLVSKSHIVPNFIFDPIYDKDHKINKLKPGDFIQGNRKVHRPSTGEYEGSLLCSDCDNARIGQYESYANQLLFSSNLPAGVLKEIGVTETGIPITRYSNIDYGRTKLFFLSILWRASISSRDFFKEILLDTYEDEVRLMILNGDPKRTSQFPIILFDWSHDDSISHDFVAQPSINRKAIGVRYVFPLGRITAVFHVLPESMEENLLPFTLQENGIATLFHVPKGKGRELIMSYFNIPPGAAA